MLPDSPPRSSSYRTAECSLESSPESAPANPPEPSSKYTTPVTRIEAGRTIVLLGAPRASQLVPNDRDIPLPASRDPSSSADHVTPTPDPSTDSPVAWRILPLKRKHLHTGFSQPADVYTPVVPQAEEDSTSASFSSSALPVSAYGTDGDDDDDVDSRSFAVHNILSSPVVDPDLTISFASTDITDSFSSFASSVPPSSLPNIQTAALTDLGNLPSANYLESIKLKYRISIIAGITHIFPQRTFQPKYSHSLRSKQTLVVGDETAAGFKIDLWLPPGPLTFAGKTFMDTVDSLRVGDVINVQNMALGVWDKQVNGATVRKDQTTIRLVYRTICSDTKERRRWRAIDLDSSSEDNRGAEKVKRVVEWTREFLGAGERPNKKSREGYREEETLLPADTQ